MLFYILLHTKWIIRWFSPSKVTSLQLKDADIHHLSYSSLFLSYSEQRTSILFLFNILWEWINQGYLIIFRSFGGWWLINLNLLHKNEDFYRHLSNFIFRFYCENNSSFFARSKSVSSNNLFKHVFLLQNCAMNFFCCKNSILKSSCK